MPFTNANQLGYMDRRTFLGGVGIALLSGCTGDSEENRPETTETDARSSPDTLTAEGMKGDDVRAEFGSIEIKESEIGGPPYAEVRVNFYGGSVSSDIPKVVASTPDGTVLKSRPTYGGEKIPLYLTEEYQDGGTVVLSIVFDGEVQKQKTVEFDGFED